MAFEAADSMFGNLTDSGCCVSSGRDKLRLVIHSCTMIKRLLAIHV